MISGHNRELLDKNVFVGVRMPLFLLGRRRRQNRV